MTAPTPDDLARAWAANLVRNVRDTTGREGELAHAFRAGWAAALERAAGAIREWEPSEADYREADELRRSAWDIAADRLSELVTKLAG